MDSPTPPTIATAGGAVINGSVDLNGGDFIGRDFIGRDKIINVIVLIPPAQQDKTVATPSTLHLLNFARPLSEPQRQQIEELIDRRIGTMIEVAVQFDESRAFAPQCVTLLDRLALSKHDWQTLPIVVNLPGFTPGAACLLGELHGRMGHFPSIVRLTPQLDNHLHEYAVTEIINLQAVRDAARKRK